MRNWIRKWLGIKDLENDIRSMSFMVAKYHAELTALTKDEFHPDRVQASSELGRQVLARLEAEDAARRLTTGDL